MTLITHDTGQQKMIQQISLRATAMGLVAAFVGYASSFAIVLAGLNAMGATAAEAATGLFFATLGMGVCGVWLAFVTRTPAAVAWFYRYSWHGCWD